MIPPSLEGLRQSRRNDTNPRSSEGVCDEQQAILHHADCHEPILAFVLTAVRPFDRKSVFEYIAGHLETAIVITPVMGRFGVELFKLVILHKNTA
jgi:hypothetical protein